MSSAQSCDSQSVPIIVPSDMFQAIRKILNQVELVQPSSHIILSFSNDDYHRLKKLCSLSNTQCIIPSLLYPSKFEVDKKKTHNFPKLICSNCAIIVMMKTKKFQSILQLIEGPKFSLIWKNKVHCILSYSMCIPQIQSYIWKNKSYLKTLLQIFFVNGSCLNLNGNRFFHEPCCAEFLVFYMVKFLHKRKYLLWFLTVKNGKYFKQLIIEYQKKIENKMKGPRNLFFEHAKKMGGFFKQMDINYHKEYLIYSLKKQKRKKPLQYVYIALRMYEQLQLRLNPIQNKPCVYSTYARDKKCNNRLCNRCLYVMYKCRKCQMVFYCSRKCQKIDWNKFHHRVLCDLFL